MLENISKNLSEKTLYIADGHHRYETSLKYRNEMREKHPEAGPDQPWDYMMMFLVNTHAEGMLVLPTHRQIKNLDDSVVAQVGNKLRDTFDVTTYSSEEKAAFTADLRSGAANTLGLYGPGLDDTGDNVYAILRPSPGWESKMPTDRPSDWNNLDVSILHVLLLNAIMGISLDPGESKANLDFEVDDEQVVTDVDSGSFQFAAFLNTTPLESVQRIADIGETMPQKSTYFYPKPLSGMVIRELASPLD